MAARIVNRSRSSRRRTFTLGLQPTCFLDAQFDTVGEYRVELDINVDTAGAPPSLFLGRMLVEYNSDEALRSFIADLRPCSFSALCKNIRLSAFYEVAGVGIVIPPTITTHASAAPGHAERGSLIYTSQTRLYNAAGAEEPVPPHAQQFSVASGVYTGGAGAVDYSEATPIDSYIAFGDGTTNPGPMGGQYDMALCIGQKRPVPNPPLYSNIGGPASNLSYWNHYCGDPNDTTAFRVIFYLDV